MLVTERFVFLHVPKTAGTFIQSVLLDHMPVVDTGEQTHMPYSSLRPEWRELPGLTWCATRGTGTSRGFTGP